MADRKLFKRLQRLFSSDVVIRNVGGNQIKTIDVNKIQQSGTVETNSLINRYHKAFTNSPTSLYGKQASFNYQTLRPVLYAEYDVMDTDAIIASALDIVADEATLKNDMGEVLQIRSPDEAVQKILYNLFYDVLNIEFNLWSWVRNMCKYGDFFLKLEIAEKFGVYNILPYTAFNIERIEGMDEENPTEVTYRYEPEGISASSYGYHNLPGKHENSNAIIFQNYEVSHFRLLSDMNFLPYGRSYLEPARKLFKSYTLMEDAMLIHRIVRAPEKRIFYMNIGSIPSNEVDAFMEKTITKLKRIPHLDTTTGDYNLRYSMQNILEDFYIPIRGNDTNTKIENLTGMQWEGIKDVEYLRSKLFAALKVPKAFMGYDEFTEGKSTLAAQDIRFARTVERIQRIIVSELYKIALVHLYTQGYREDDLVNFDLSLTTPSIIYDQEKINLLKEKVDLASTILENQILPSDWVYDNIFHLSEENFDDYRDLIAEDMKRKFRWAQIGEEGNDPSKTGKSYGTPHDLASLYGQGRYAANSLDVPEGYDEDKDIGRPQEKASNINTQDNALGKDRLGNKGMKSEKDNNPLGTKKHGNSTLSLEGNSNYLKNKKMLSAIPQKKLVFEGEDKDISFLNENNIKEQEA